MIDLGKDLPGEFRLEVGEGRKADRCEVCE